MLSLTFNVLFLWILKIKLHKKLHKRTMNQFGLATSMRFALLVRCLISSFTRRFLFSSLESVIKWNIIVFVYT